MRTYFAQAELLASRPVAFQQQTLVRFQDVDAAGVVFFPTLLAYMHDAYVAFLKAHGCDLPRVLAQSPHAFAAHMATPTLVTHGAQDFRVPDCNGLAYYNTLKARGVDARLLWFPDENHWILKPQNSVQWHNEVNAWLKAHTQ